MLWLQAQPCHPQHMKFPFYHQHFPQVEGTNMTPPFSTDLLVTLLKEFSNNRATQSMRHGNLKTNTQMTFTLQNGNLNSSIHFHTRSAHQPLKYQLRALWGHYSWQSLSTLEKYIMFLKGLHGYCIRNSFYKKKRDPLLIVYIAVKHHLKNYTKKPSKKWYLC